MRGYVFRIDLERELADALREIDRLRVTLTATENVLRNALTQGTQCGRIAGPYARGHFCECPDDGCLSGWKWPRSILVTGEIARGSAGFTAARVVVSADPPARCSECERDLHGYRGPLCRYCDGTAE